MSDFLPLTAPVGSAYAAYKSALMSNLQTRTNLQDVVVSYDSPYNLRNVRTDEGKYEAIFWGDEGSGVGPTTKMTEQENVIICSLPLRLDEEIPIPLTIQVLNPGSEGTQEEADHRVDQLLFEVYSEIAGNPTQGLHNTPGFDYIHATKATTFERITGILTEDSQGRGALARIYIWLEARISFTPDFS